MEDEWSKISLNGECYCAQENIGKCSLSNKCFMKLILFSLYVLFNGPFRYINFILFLFIIGVHIVLRGVCSSIHPVKEKKRTASNNRSFRAWKWWCRRWNRGESHLHWERAISSACSHYRNAYCVISLGRKGNFSWVCSGFCDSQLITEAQHLAFGINILRT